jgi:hypothetical protein
VQPAAILAQEDVATRTTTPDCAVKTRIGVRDRRDAEKPRNDHGGHREDDCPHNRLTLVQTDLLSKEPHEVRCLPARHARSTAARERVRPGRRATRQPATTVPAALRHWLTPSCETAAAAPEEFCVFDSIERVERSYPKHYTYAVSIPR